jgi:hypothetical protein
LDLTNAFNTLDRTSIATGVSQHLPMLYRGCKWAYNAPAPLLLNKDGMISLFQSSSGVRQGDPLGPLLFSIGFRKKFEVIKKFASDRGGEAWCYLDDVILLLPCDELNPTEDWKKDLFDALRLSLESVQDGLELNLVKCKCVGLFEAFESGFDLFGSHIGNATSQCKFLKAKMSEWHSSLEKIATLGKQASQLLFRFCLMNQTNYLIRTLDPIATCELWNQLGQEHFSFLARLAEVDALPELSCFMAHLPLRSGGVGIPVLPVVSHSGYTASSTLASSLFTFLAEHSRHPSTADLSATPKQKDIVASQLAPLILNFQNKLKNQELVALADFASPCGRAFWRLLPLDQSLYLPDAAMIWTLRNRLFLVSPPTCPTCSGVNSVFHHEVCIRSHKEPALRRHNLLLAAVSDTLVKRPDTRVNREVCAPNSNLRADLVIRGKGSLNQNQSTVDVTVVSYSSNDSNMVVEKCIRSADETPIKFGRRMGSLLIQKRESEKKKKYISVFPDLVPLVFLPAGSTNYKISKWLGMNAQFRIAAALAVARVAQS